MWDLQAVDSSTSMDDPYCDGPEAGGSSVPYVLDGTGHFLGRNPLASLEHTWLDGKEGVGFKPGKTYRA